MPDHARLQELFLAACDLSEDQQQDLIDSQCSDDPVLRQELKQLLRTDARSGGIFADDRVTKGIQFQFDTDVETELPNQIGRYKIKQLLGEGGMGVVYLAEQQNPVRDVAIKVIRPGMLNSELVKRFELEAAVLGRLAHPCIAKIYEAGVFVDNTTGLERPYLAMEYIDGQSLRKSVERSNPSTRERLQLLIQVCRAVHHAHQRGVIHRDLKPSNVLVKNADGEPSILDFGVARVTGLDPDMSTLQTRTGQLIGTLPYMSPEQVTGNSLEVDTRTDIYSLGVIAYEMLSGKLPYEIIESDYLKSAKMISEESPLALSAVNRDFRGDLNTVVLKALEKDPEQRYQSAKELGDDFQRFLDGQPIVASPVGFTGRCWKWCQRNKAVATLLGLLALAITAGFIGITKQTFDAVHARELAEESERGTERTLELLIRSFRSPDPTIAGHDVKMVDVLIKAAADLEADSDVEPLIKARLLNAIGESFQSLGVFDKGVNVHKAALAIRTRELGERHPDTMSSMANLGAMTYRTGDFVEALRLFQRSTDLRIEVLGAEHPDTLKSMNDLAVGYRANGKLEESIELTNETYQIMERMHGPGHLDTLKVKGNIARIHRQKGELDLALPIVEELLQQAKEHLGEQHPLTANTQSQKAEICSDIRPAGEALPINIEAMELNREVLGENHLYTLTSTYQTAVLYFECNNEQETIRILEPLLPTLRKELGDKYWLTLASTARLVVAYLRVNRAEEALVLVKQELQTRQAAGHKPSQKANAKRYLAEALIRTGQQEKGIEVLNEYLQFGLEHANDDPEVLAIVGNVYLKANMFIEAESYYRQSAEALEELELPDNWGQFAGQSALGAALAGQGKFEAAEPLLLSGARGLLDAKSTNGPPFPKPRNIADALERIIRLYEQTEQPEQAKKWQLIADEQRIHMP